MYLKDKLRTMDDEKFSLISTIQMKDPTTLLLVSIFLGTLGCCGILTIVDWFTISKKARERNFNKVMSLL